jgi:DNA-binding Lrp family transcriptional regulator
MRKDIIAMSRKELNRLPILHKAIDRRLTQVEAAEMLELSARQIRRIIKKIVNKGDEAIIHGNRGNPSPRKLPQSIEKDIVSLLKKKYYNFGPTFAAEKLLELEKIKISKEKLRQIMIGHDIKYLKRKEAGKVYQWRERKQHVGEMIQMDGSDHDWLEGRGPKMVLMGYIDDATSRIFGQFHEYEGTFPAMNSFRRYIGKYGLPFSFYIDRHSTYRTTRQPTIEEDLKAEFPKTQFGRLLNELDVKIIYARSPQAKGRIERAFGTLQDRLTKEMRLAGISSLEQANEFLKEYLPKHNARFAVDPAKRTNLHRPVPKHLNLDDIFCVKEFRTVTGGYTIQWKNRIFLIKNPSITMKRQRVCVMEHFNGTIALKLKDKCLSFEEVTAKDMMAVKKAKLTALKLVKKARVYRRQPDNHPWKRFVISPKRAVNYA